MTQGKASPSEWYVQPGGRFLALKGAPVPRTRQSGMPVGVRVAQAPRPPQYGCARSSKEENVVQTPTPGGLLPPSRVTVREGTLPPEGGRGFGGGVGYRVRLVYSGAPVRLRCRE